MPLVRKMFQPLVLICPCTRTGQIIEAFTLEGYGNPIAVRVCTYCKREVQTIPPSQEVRSHSNHG